MVKTPQTNQKTATIVSQTLQQAITNQQVIPLLKNYNLFPQLLRGERKNAWEELN